MNLLLIVLILAIVGKCASHSEEVSLDFLLADVGKKVESIAVPSAEPTAEPTLAPSANPSASPSAVPSVDPSVAPSASPSAFPSADPSVEPTVMPSMVPSNSPSEAPTFSPSAMPTFVPTAPSAMPTFTPTAVPSANNLVTFQTQTTLDNVSPQQYVDNRKACNLTIAAAASSVMPGTKPEDIQDIGLADEDTRVGRGLQSSAKLRFTVRTYLTGASYESLSSALEEAAVSGAFTSQVQFFAVQNNVPVLQNVTVLAITTENDLVGREGSEKLTGSMVAGLVIGIFLALGFIAVVVYFFFSHLIFPASSNAAAGANGANNAPVENNNEVADVESPRELANQI
eukprot:CAMPEP_0184969770 /NCGR_PEP_ID=MMETSP1098-20130426/2438_1 /TAXON_ID=89044 /ORGANISM="Spumella elongata, Strain CCAP 955/1" /LENGTH=341 /DNA_ID=CAMNT_0027491583 /DNA_START=51 /DNA_END=1076 /DNA_ORIENTATION=-